MAENGKSYIQKEEGRLNNLGGEVMNIKFAVCVFAASLYGCGPAPTDITDVEEVDLEGCLYAGVLYSPGTMKQSEKAVSDGRGVRMEQDPDGVMMECIADTRATDVYRWNVSALSTR